ncbi:MAG: flagellar basal body rod protein FlgC [bacterium]|nr:flagellar basal body rod protein FlgC [bacterium]
MSNNIFSSFQVSAAGLRAQRMRLDAAAENLANIETTRTQNGEPYRPRKVVFESTQTAPENRPTGPGGFESLLATRAGHMSSAPLPSPETMEKSGEIVKVRIAGVEDPFRSEFDPDHPDADEDGIVLKPNVDPINEMLTLIKATRAYEANATALDAAKEMLNRALDI